jgi:lipopolysaccharide export system protein LptC
MQLGTRTAIAFPLVLLGFIAMITFWIDYSVQLELPRIDGSRRHDPDYIMSNFETLQTDINGDLRYKLQAVEMRHFPDDDTTALVQPDYVQFAVNKPYTRVVSQRGFVSSNGEEVQLVDNVVITRQAFEDKGEMTVETDFLKIRPNDEIAMTDRPVVIKQAPKTIIYATGMVYEKKKKTITLQHRVRAHYEKPIVNKPPQQKAKPEKTKSKAASKQKKSLNQPSASSKNSNIQNSNTKNSRIRRTYE